MPTLLERFRSARLARTTAVYASGSFVLLQVLDMFEGRLGLPDWVFTASLILLLIGFPIILTTAWLQSKHTASSKETDTQSPALARRLFTWRRAITGGIAAFTLVTLTAGGYLALRAAGIGPAATLVTSGVMDRSDRLVLAHFSSLSGDAGLAPIATELIRSGLVESRVVRLLAPDTIRSTLRLMRMEPNAVLYDSTAREVAVRAGAKAVIRGTVASAGKGSLITVEVVRATTGEVLAALHEMAPADDPTPAIDKLSRRLRARIGESLSVIQSEPPLARVTTSSLDALRKYVQGHSAANGGNLEQAISLYDEAIALDSSFALAWSSQAISIVNSNGTVITPRARAAFQRAYDLRDRLPPREVLSVEANKLLYLDYDPAAAARKYQEMMDRGYFVGQNTFGLMLHMAADFAGAERVLSKALGGSYFAYSNLAAAQLNQNKVAEAEATVDSLSRVLPKNARVRRIRAQIAATRGQYDEAERWTRELTAPERPATERMEGNTRLANLALTRGRLAEALALTRERGTSPIELARQIIHARTLLRADQLNWALALLDSIEASARSSSLEPEERSYLELAYAWSEAGLPKRAAAAIEQLTKGAPAGYLKSRATAVKRAQARIAIANQRPQDAVALLADSVPDLCPRCTLHERALAHYAARQHDLALEEYRQFIDVSAQNRIDGDAFNLGPALERVAQLYDAAGKSKEAIAYYARFVELWKNADAVLQPRVQAAQRRMIELARVSG